MKKNLRMKLFLVLFALSTLVYTQGCNNSEAEQEPEAQNDQKKVNVRIEKVQPTVFISQLKLVGEVEADNDAIISGQVLASLTSITADKGTRVAKGDTILVLDDRRPRAIYNMAIARVENARLDHDVAKKQYESGLGVSETQYLKIKNAFLAAEAELENAKVDLENCFIIAPFKGVVAERYVDLGELVNPGAPLVRVVDNGTLRIRAGVPENQAGPIKRGANASIGVKEINLQLDGKIRWVGATLDPRSRTLPIEISIKSDWRLKPGMITEVSLEKFTSENAIVIPLSVLQKAPDHFFVYVYEEGKASHREVETGETNGNEVEILSGLTFNDNLVIDGYRDLVDQQEVVVVGRVDQ